METARRDPDAMTRRLAALTLLALASLAPAASAAEPGADAAKTYRLETAGTTGKVAVGKPGLLVLSIVPIERLTSTPAPRSRSPSTRPRG